MSDWRIGISLGKSQVQYVLGHCKNSFFAVGNYILNFCLFPSISQWGRVFYLTIAFPFAPPDLLITDLKRRSQVTGRCWEGASLCLD